MNEPYFDPLINVKSGAAMLNVSSATWWRRVKDGTLPPGIRIGCLTRWRLSEVQDAVARAASRRDVNWPPKPVEAADIVGQLPIGRRHIPSLTGNLLSPLAASHMQRRANMNTDEAMATPGAELPRVVLDGSMPALRECRWCGGYVGILLPPKLPHGHGVQCADCLRQLGWLPKNFDWASALLA